MRISERSIQFWNELVPIVVVVFGIFIDVKFLQPLNALLPIVTSLGESPKSTFFRKLSFWNEFVPIVVKV